MKKLLLFCCLLFPTYITYAQKSSGKNFRLFKLPAGVTSKDYIPGTIIVKFKTSAQSSAKTLSVKQLATVKLTNVISLQKKFPDQSSSETQASARNKFNYGLDRIYEAKISGSVNIETVINELLGDPQIEYAEPSYIHHTNYIPNDPRYTSNQQSHLNLIKAPQAWDIVRNSSGVIIAIVDSGSELTHPDLAANIYYNSADPVNGADDDGDGFVDNYAGWDFVGSSASNIQGDNNPNVVGPSNDHGVHVSGIASAVTDNNTGVASVAFNAKLLIVKAGPDDSGSDIYRGYEGIKYAADKGAKVINCSWGSRGASNFGRDIVNYAIGKGCLIVAAAGNTSSNIPDYPAGYEGVIAVANTDNLDEKASSSNYGNYVSIAAPGTGILSTIYGNSYGLNTGTSMASPLVASAAALVKSNFPLLNMQQVGELLRVTADNIDNKNQAYAGMMGRGRLNIFRALTESPPSVRIQAITQNEVNASNVVNPDTLYLYFDLKNFLFPVTNLKLTLTSPNPDATILTPPLTIISLNTLETKLAGPIKVAIRPDISSNSPIEFRLDYAANNNTYLDFQGFSVIVAKDYLDIHTNSVSTTMTSNGRVGYSLPSEENGLGFVYKGTQMLYEASLMVGVSSTKVSNSARSVSDQHDEHFVKIIKAHELVNNADSIVAESQFDDSANQEGLSISVKQLITAYKASPNDKYVITEYEVFNKTNSELRNAYIGLFSDWDIGSSESNVTLFDPSSRLAYVYNKQQANKYAGVKLLSQNVPPLYYPLANITGNPLEDQDFTTTEKWETLSSGIKSLGIGASLPSGADVAFVSGNGPYNIPANGSIKVAFALIGGENVQDLQASAAIAQQKYNLISVQPPQQPITSLELQAYPNPVMTTVSGMNTLRFALPEEGNVTLELFNFTGQKVRTLIANQVYSSGVHFLNYDFANGLFADVNPGIYIYRLTCNSRSKSTKLSILR